eukprot:6256707-Karenia_brevis.AAC.1
MSILKAANVVFRDTAIAMPEGETESNQSNKLRQCNIDSRHHSEKKSTGPTYTIPNNTHTSIIHNSNTSIDKTQMLNIRAHMVDN